MSFTTRHLTEEFIRHKSQDEFLSIERFMINADSYLIKDEWSIDVFTEFRIADEEQRKLIHKQIKDEIR